MLHICWSLLIACQNFELIQPVLWKIQRMYDSVHRRTDRRIGETSIPLFQRCWGIKTYLLINGYVQSYRVHVIPSGSTSPSWGQTTTTQHGRPVQPSRHVEQDRQKEKSMKQENSIRRLIHSLPCEIFHTEAPIHCLYKSMFGPCSTPWPL